MRPPPRRVLALAVALLAACAQSSDADDVPVTKDSVAMDDVAPVDDLAPVDIFDASVPDVVADRPTPDVVADRALPDAPQIDTPADRATIDTPTDITTPDAPVFTDVSDVDTAPVDAGCDMRLPAGWPARIAPWSANPVLVASSGVDAQGHDNVYAPDVHRVGEASVMWYGAQGRDGHDRIYVAASRGGGAWRKWPTDLAPSPALDRGASNHVNDPSVVAVGDLWRMYYTDAPTAENDRIWLAESRGLSGFAKVTEVLGVGPAGSWDEEKVGRPSVLLEGGVYRMWYDGTARGARHVGLATSTDGVHFVRHPANPLFLNAGAVDVKRVGGVYVMLREGGDGTYWATSPDGICWIDRGRLFGLSGGAYDRFGQVTPFLETDGDALRAVWFGGASVVSWDHNRIAFALPDGASAPPGGGCTGCLPAGQSCAAACQSASGGRDGVCGAPGSAEPGRCCACVDDGCGRCTTAPDCHAACVSAGAVTGWCGVPGSTDSSRCCTCLR